MKTTNDKLETTIGSQQKEIEKIKEQQINELKKLVKKLLKQKSNNEFNKLA
ncbi:MAG: hypothetical protein ABIP79_06230 [Chitinophagaceae bacterium]